MHSIDDRNCMVGIRLLLMCHMMNKVDVEATGFFESQMIGKSMGVCSIGAVMENCSCNSNQHLDIMQNVMQVLSTQQQ